MSSYRFKGLFFLLLLLFMAGAGGVFAQNADIDDFVLRTKITDLPDKKIDLPDKKIDLPDTEIVLPETLLIDGGGLPDVSSLTSDSLVQEDSPGLPGQRRVDNIDATFTRRFIDREGAGLRDEEADKSKRDDILKIDDEQETRRGNLKRLLRKRNLNAVERAPSKRIRLGNLFLGTNVSAGARANSRIDLLSKGRKPSNSVGSFIGLSSSLTSAVPRVKLSASGNGRFSVDKNLTRNTDPSYSKDVSANASFSMPIAQNVGLFLDGNYDIFDLNDDDDFEFLKLRRNSGARIRLPINLGALRLSPFARLEQTVYPSEGFFNTLNFNTTNYIAGLSISHPVRHFTPSINLNYNRSLFWGDRLRRQAAEDGFRGDVHNETYSISGNLAGQVGSVRPSVGAGHTINKVSSFFGRDTKSYFVTGGLSYGSGIFSASHDVRYSAFERSSSRNNNTPLRNNISFSSQFGIRPNPRLSLDLFLRSNINNFSCFTCQRRYEHTASLETGMSLGPGNWNIGASTFLYDYLDSSEFARGFFVSTGYSLGLIKDVRFNINTSYQYGTDDFTDTKFHSIRGNTSLNISKSIF